METTKETLQAVLKVGEKYTIYRMNSTIAAAFKREITIKELTEDGIIYTEGGGRKRYIMCYEDRHYSCAPLKPLSCAFFAGWGQPFRLDTEGDRWSGNACFNFIGDPAALREWIETKQINPFFERSNLLAISGGDFDRDGQLIFPEEYEQGRHAVIDRILSTQTA